MLRLYQGTEQVGSDAALLLLTPGASQEFTFTYTAKEAGDIPFTAVADPDGAITELDEANNELSTTLEVLSSGIQASVSTDKASYLPEEDVLASSVVRNDSDRERTLYLNIYAEDASGNYVGDFNGDYISSLAPGEEWTSTSSWNTGLNYSGDYRVHADVYDSYAEKASATISFAIEPQGSLALSATCDRVSYSVGDVAGLRARLISEALNFCFSGLTVRGEVLSPDRIEVGTILIRRVNDYALGSWRRLGPSWPLPTLARVVEVAVPTRAGPARSPWGRTRDMCRSRPTRTVRPCTARGTTAQMSFTG